ncbi:MAG: bifunctional [glutamine synthetase] adenylyltransferase/[glutamine synthetase]-adenylyl-L-tyrosine phosphorylase [Parvularculaceae bacterium]|nr:bifunctional [glutamine synthetase] adenylyltransferase/[glutamine synthetase]-adenylyl-L-tyrosine phosphorylase [Parvularculaceae bacterium]
MTENAPLESLVRFTPDPFDRRAGEQAVEAFGPAFGARDFLAGVAGCSPYLARLIAGRPELAMDALSHSPAENLERAIAAAWRAADTDDPADQMNQLRRAKNDAALSLALAEISGALTTLEAARSLSGFAGAAVNASLRMALRRCERYGFNAADPQRPEKDCGIAILAMGKLGAFELNYSSDIDLVVLFDSESERLGGADEAKRIAVAATRAMVKSLNDQTPAGYVFRTDLRLRPDPGVSAAAVSINAAETYYESYGQNWERAAFIKARAAAGDIRVGEEFLGRLRPFIWRKFLDFSAIEEVYAVMRQIHASKDAGRSEFFGHDLKRGHGGIRAIEFFVQTQQLIGGGKNAELRRRATLDALGAIEAAGVIEKDTREGLAREYEYLRKVEHRLHMINDEQTHRIPANENDAARLAAFLGESPLDAFRDTMTNTFRNVSRLTAPLYHPEEKNAPRKAFSFSGVDNDPQTIKALADLGFERPAQIAEAVRRWHAGDTRAARSARARALLEKITPSLIEAFANARSPDEAFVAFDGFLRGLPAGVQIFSLFLNRPEVFERLIRIMTVSPYLAREVAKRAWLAEALIESSWPDPTPERDELERRLKARLAAADNYETTINAVRRWKSEEAFSAAAQMLVDLIPAGEAAERFTLIAETSLAAMLDIACGETQRQFGPMAGEIAVVALGRLGARTMTAASDVDLMFIYDAPDAAGADAQGIDAVTYFARLVRRFLTGVTTPSEEDALYEVDMQLRPSGAKGPAAVRFSSFVHYYEKDAWTWEAMALTKARVIAGGAALRGRIENEIDAILRRKRDSAAVARDVEDMRSRLGASKPATSPWDLKYAIGGFIEIDFTLQYLLLTHPQTMDYAVRSDANALIGALAAQGALNASQADRLLKANRIYETAQQLSRAATGGVFAPGAAGHAMALSMTRLFDTDDLAEAEAMLAALEQETRAVYEEIVVAALPEKAP